jgi:hypothetical protein
MAMDISVFERELDALEGNKRAETKKEMTRLSGVCKGQPDELIARKLKKLLGSEVGRSDLAKMVATLKTGEKLAFK